MSILVCRTRENLPKLGEGKNTFSKISESTLIACTILSVESNWQTSRSEGTKTRVMGFDKPLLWIYEWQLENLMTTALKLPCSVLHALDWCLNVWWWIKGKKEITTLTCDRELSPIDSDFQKIKTLKSDFPSLLFPKRKRIKPCFEQTVLNSPKIIHLITHNYWRASRKTASRELFINRAFSNFN